MTATPKHHWYQFSLKMLLVGMTVLCIGPGGYVAYEQAKARREKAAVEAIEKLGGKFEYDLSVPVRSVTIRQVLGKPSGCPITSTLAQNLRIMQVNRRVRPEY